jgi:hypothetical protein
VGFLNFFFFFFFFNTPLFRMGCLLLCVVLLSIGSVSGVFDGSSSGRLEEGPKHGARIVGGVDVSLTSAYPYQCGLFDARSRQFLCGCSLISPSWVLTAAACVRSIEGAAESDRNVSSLQAVFGTVQLAQSHRVMALARLLIHPSFVAAVSPAARVNLAWLQVAGGPVVAAFSASVRPVALADARSEPALLLPGAVAAVAGWGGAGSSGSSGALAAAGVAVRSADECSALLQSAGQLPLASFELCAGANATGPCAGALVCSSRVHCFVLFVLFICFVCLFCLFVHARALKD